jgi:hypothetical protein
VAKVGGYRDQCGRNELPCGRLFDVLKDSSAKSDRLLGLYFQLLIPKFSQGASKNNADFWFFELFRKIGGSRFRADGTESVIYEPSFPVDAMPEQYLRLQDTFWR